MINNVKKTLIFRFDSKTRLNHLVVSNNVFILHVNDKTLQRRCPDDAPKDPKASSAYQGSIFFYGLLSTIDFYFFTDIHMSDVINKVFLDPTGRLVIVSTRDKREVHILVSSVNSLKLHKKPIRFPTSPSFVLASVSWCNRFFQQNETIALVAGQDGSIFQVTIQPDGDWALSNEVYPSFKTILATSREELTGIYCDVKSSYEDNSNLFVVITTKK